MKKIFLLYSHLDSTTTVGQSVVSAAHGIDHIPPSVAAKKQHAFAEDLGQGVVRITFITWAQ